MTLTDVDGKQVSASAHLFARWAKCFRGSVVTVEASFRRAERVTFARLLAWASTGRTRPFRVEDEYRYDAEAGAMFVLAPGRRDGVIVVVTVFRFTRRAKRKGIAFDLGRD